MPCYQTLVGNATEIHTPSLSTYFLFHSYYLPRMVLCTQYVTSALHADVPSTICQVKNLPGLTQLVNSRAGIQTRLSDSSLCSFHGVTVSREVNLMLKSQDNLWLNFSTVTRSKSPCLLPVSLSSETLTESICLTELDPN